MAKVRGAVARSRFGRSAEAHRWSRELMVFAALRVLVAVLGLVTLLAQPGQGGHRQRGELLAANGLLLVAAAVALGWLLAGEREVESYRRFALVSTSLDLVGYLLWTAAFHDLAANSSALGVLVFIEGPVFWGRWRGAVVPAAVAGIALLMPQVDALGRTPPPEQTLLVSVLLYGVTAVVTTFLRRTSAQLRQAHEQFRLVFQSSSTGLALLDLTGRVLDGNRALAASFDRPVDRLLGCRLTDLCAEGQRQLLESALARAAAEPAGQRFELRFCAAGRVFDGIVELTRVEGGPGVPPLIAAHIEDVSERKAFEEQLSHQATHDELTGLPNRVYLRARLEEALSARPGWAPCAVLFCDLDRFKRVNDTLGHDFGDVLLTEVAGRLRAVVRPGDVVARQGGDEFVVLVHGVWSEGDVTPLAERILAALREPVRLAGRELHLGGSIGISIAHPGERPEVLLRDADTAMYRAKARGGGCAVVFNPSMHDALVAQHELESTLRAQLETGSVPLLFQAGLDLRTGRIAMLEALVNLRQDGVVVPPARLTAVADEAGLGDALVARLLDGALAGLASWPGYGGAVAVAASTRQVASPGFVAVVSDALARCGVGADRLVLEVPEDALVEEKDAATRSLTALREAGVRIAIDDFGMGQASLSRLSRIPADIVKVHRAFTTTAATEPRSRSIVQGVVGLARAFALDVVADGIQTQDQLAQMRNLGVDLACGPLLAEPVPAEAVPAQLSMPRIAGPRQSVEAHQLTR